MFGSSSCHLCRPIAHDQPAHSIYRITSSTPWTSQFFDILLDISVNIHDIHKNSYFNNIARIPRSSPPNRILTTLQPLTLISMGYINSASYSLTSISQDQTSSPIISCVILTLYPSTGPLPPSVRIRHYPSTSPDFLDEILPLPTPIRSYR